MNDFPSSWKSAKVIPIRKPGKDPSSPKSYRPISLLSGLSKLFEKAIHHRLLESAENLNILLEEQFGFRRGRSTVHQLTRVTNVLRRNKFVSKTSAMALLDVEKAFDNVWHDGLVYKLQRYNLPSYLVKIINNYLSARTFRVSISGASSNAHNIVAGVPQGSILGPLLFNLFTSDMPEPPEGGILSLFADDTSIVYNGRVIRALVAKLQRGLDALTEYLTSWKICINAAKTQVIIFPHSKSPKLVPPGDCKIILNGTTVEWANEAGYLGLTLDSKLIFRQQVDKTVTKCNVLLKLLYPLINRRSSLSLKNKLAVYKQIILPVIEYGMPVWESCAKTHHLKLQRVQNKFLRMILNTPPRTRTSEVHRLAGIKTLHERFGECKEKFRVRCLHSDQAPIRALVPI